MGQFVRECSGLPPGRKINCESEKVVSVFFFPGDRSNHGVFPTQLDLSHPPSSPTTTTLGTADHTSLPFRVSTNWLRLLERESKFPSANYQVFEPEFGMPSPCILSCNMFTRLLSSPNNAASKHASLRVQDHAAAAKKPDPRAAHDKSCDFAINLGEFENADR